MNFFLCMLQGNGVGVMEEFECSCCSEFGFAFGLLVVWVQLL